MSEPLNPAGGVADTNKAAPETAPVAPQPAPTQTAPVAPNIGAQVTGIEDATTQASQPVQFHSAGIGTQTVVKQDPFKEQNQKAAEKKKSQSEHKKIMFIVGAAVIGVMIVGLLIWLIVALVTKEPEDGLTSDERKVQQMQTQANNLYNNPNNAESDEETSGEDVTAAKEFFDNVKDESRNDDERIQALLAELEFWSVKDQPDLALQAAREIGDFRDLNTNDAIRYCSAYMDAVTALDDPDSVDVSACDQFLMEQEGDEDNGYYEESSVE